MKIFFQKYWSIVFIVLLWGAFSSPFLFQGKIPYTGDYQVTFFPPWSQYSQFTQPVKNSAMPDVIDQIYPWKNLVIDSWKHLQIPLWNPYSFGGTPLMANYQSAAFSPMNVLFFVFPFKISWSLLVLFQPLLAGVGMYFFLRKLSVSQIGSTLSSVSFMFCGFITCWMGYGTLGYAIGILPLILFGLEEYRQSKKFWYLCLVAEGLAFSFVSGHFQISIYTSLVSFTYFLFRFLPLRDKKIFFYGLAALFSGILLSLPQLLPSMEFYAQSLRSTLFQRPEVIPWNYLFTFIAPDFFGNPVTRNDWFGHYAEWNGYIGVIPFLFGLYSLTVWKKNSVVRFFSLLALFSLLFATPTLLGDLILFARVPVLATSAAGRIIVVVSFSLAVMAGFGLDAWIFASKTKKLFLGVLGLVFLLIGWITVFGKIGLSPEHVVIAKQNFILPSLFLMSTLFACFAAYFIKNKKIIIVLSFALLAFSFFDVYRFAYKWQTFSPKDTVFPDVGVTKFFETIKNVRSLGNYGGQLAMQYKLPALEGYDALYPERFGEFISYVANGSYSPASRSVVEFPKNGRYTKETIDFLGVRYIIHKNSDTGKVWTFPFWQYPTDFTESYKDDSYTVMENKNAFPRAFFAPDYIVEKDSHKILQRLFAKDTDRARTLILEEDLGIKKIESLESSSKLTLYTPNKVIVTTQSNKDALLFLSDTYFPGWHAYVDGKETKIYRADYTFRAVVVPSGQHIVVFSYWPNSFVYGIVGFIGGMCLLVGIYFFQKKRE